MKRFFQRIITMTAILMIPVLVWGLLICLWQMNLMGIIFYLILGLLDVGYALAGLDALGYMKLNPTKT